MSSPAERPLLVVRELKKHFPLSRQAGLRRVRETVRAVDGVSFTIRSGETLGLVGESGCGKSTTGRAILRLIEPTHGTVEFDGVNLLKLSAPDLRKVRKELGVVFQDPMSALNPRMTVGDIVSEPLRVHGLVRGRRAALAEAGALLERVGLDATNVHRYPHEFSGGQRQRVGIARAIATKPRLIVLDEPISALDVSVRAQILNVLMDLQEDLGLAYLLIAHDLSVVRHVCDRVAVMYLGVIVEEAPPEELFARPLHPYTQALLAAVPHPDPRHRLDRAPIEGDVPSPTDIPKGCRFRPRCPLAAEQCAVAEPPLRPIGSRRKVACHLVPEDADT